jgi:endonuclease YncB( thermonuclease family)
MFGSSQIGSQTPRWSVAGAFAWRSRKHASGSWLQRKNRRSVVLFLLCSEVLGAACGLTLGLNLPTIPGFHKERVKSPWRTSIQVCGVGRRITCIVDGDTGWESGRKWRLLSIDAPELIAPECRAEYNKARQARARLTELMRDGYRVVWSGQDDRYGRALVEIELSNGMNASQVLQNEGLAQRWPIVGNTWCRR